MDTEDECERTVQVERVMQKAWMQKINAERVMQLAWLQKTNVKRLSKMTRKT